MAHRTYTWQLMIESGADVVTIGGEVNCHVDPIMYTMSIPATYEYNTNKTNAQVAMFSALKALSSAFGDVTNLVFTKI